MKISFSKIIGALILAVTVLASGLILLFNKSIEAIRLSGYLGGEKIGLFEDEEFSEILRKKYGIEFDYSRAGSLDMVTADLNGRNYLFPSSQNALEYFAETHGSAAADEIIFNTPIVLYSHKIVADALISQGVVSIDNGIYFADMSKLAELLLSEKQWSDIGLPQLYGSVCVDTTDPVRSNSGNLFAALLANTLNGGKTADLQSIETILPKLKQIFSRLGYMETSSSDLFNQFMRMGVGAKPIIAGYENQLIEYAVENPEKYEQVKDDLVVIYPVPTVWSAHIYIALDENGKLGAKALCDEEIQLIAWEKHGFRTGSSSDADFSGSFAVSGIQKNISAVTNMPPYAVMKRIIEGLE